MCQLPSTSSEGNKKLKSFATMTIIYVKEIADVCVLPGVLPKEPEALQDRDLDATTEWFKIYGRLVASSDAEILAGQ